METIWVKGLFKFGKKAHLQRLITEGEVHMRPLTFFRKLEGDEARADPDEGVVACVQASSAKLSAEIDKALVPVGTLNGPLRFSDERYEDLNIFCLYGLRGDWIDPRISKFGDTFVVFTDAQEFIDRVLKGLSGFGYPSTVRLVEYVSRGSYSGPMGPLKKFSRLEYESEVRFVAKTGLRRSLNLKLGSLEAISLLGDISEVNSFVAHTIIPAHQKKYSFKPD